MIEACIFDLDGVIVDTARYHYIAWKNIAEELGFVFSKDDNERLKGIGRLESLNILLQIGNINLEEGEKNRLATIKNEFYLKLIEEMKPEEILPGVTDFLKDLRKNKIRIALGSASKNAPFILERTNLTAYFDAIIDGNMVSKAKPDPEVFLKGATQLGIEPAKCLVFEDAQAGIEAAINAGMHCIGIGEHENLKGADFVIPGFQEFNYDRLRSWYL